MVGARRGPSNRRPFLPRELRGARTEGAPAQAVLPLVDAALADLAREFAKLYAPIGRIWDVTVFTKNRDRLLEGDIAAKFFRAVLRRPQIEALLSDGALHGRRHADRGLGQHEEIQAQGW
jgi:hypothetical protein